MKKFVIILIILLLATFLAYNFYKKNSLPILAVYSPSSVVIDLNKNGSIDSNELFEVDEIETFTSKKNMAQSKIAKKLHLTEEEALGLGYFAEEFAKNLLEEKFIKATFLKNGKVKIIYENTNYADVIANSPFAMKNEKPLNPAEFNKELKLVKKLNLRIFNNKSNKYHYLGCKYGQLAQDFVILPKKQIPTDAKPCNYCKIKEKNIIKSPKIKNFLFFDEYIKFYITDSSTVLKPNNSCKTNYCQELLKQINNSKTSIDIALYGYTEIKEITQAFKNAKNRGIKIRLVYDIDTRNSNFYTDTLMLSRLIQNSTCDFGEKSYQNSIMHNKFIIFDEQTLVTGSANLSTTDMSGYNSNILAFINSKELAQIYKQEFEQMYLNNFHNKKKKINDKENIKIGNYILSAYFSPQDNTINTAIIPLINQAKNYIYIPTFVITHQKLAQSLIDAKKRGVDVKIILDATNASNRHSIHEILRKNGILVKTENYAGKMHSKSMIIDDNYTIIGSMNFSKSGEIKNDENVLVIKNQNLAKYYKNFFLYFWDKIPEIWLTKNVKGESKYSIGSCFDKIDNDFDNKIDSNDEGCN